MDRALHLKKVIHIFLGTILVTFGVLGMVLPILHGTIPLIVGLILLSFESSWLEKKLLQITSRNKHLKHWHEKFESKLRAFFNIEKYHNAKKNRAQGNK